MLRLATMQDLTRIMAIVQATVMEMHAYGNYQWDEVYPTEQDFASDITQGDLFVSEAEGQICGLICINQIEPAVYADAGWSSSEKALVLHRMAVDPTCAAAVLALNCCSRQKRSLSAWDCVI